MLRCGIATKRATPVLRCIGHGGDGKTRCEGTAAIISVSMPPEGAGLQDWVFGVRWTPESFLQQAVSVGHPFKSFSGLSDDVRAACEFVAGAAHEQVVELRCKKLGSCLQKVRSLESEEKLLKEKMPLERRRILESKRIAFMRHVIQEEGYDDKHLADDLEQGFAIVGEAPRSSVLPSKVVPATISQQDLGLHSSKANKALRYMTRSSGDDALDNQLWEKTQAEVTKGWMVGPLDWDALPPGSSASRRFPLAQAGKVRPIDDLSQWTADWVERAVSGLSISVPSACYC